MIQEEYPSSSRQEAVEMVLKAISAEPSSVLLPNAGKGNAKTIIEMADAIIEYIKSGKVPVSSSGGQVTLTR